MLTVLGYLAVAVAGYGLGVLFGDLRSRALWRPHAGHRGVVLAHVANECVRQDLKWGAFRDLDDSAIDVPISSARIAKQVCDRAMAEGRETWAHILVEEVAEAVEATSDAAQLRGELVQVAAVCVQWVQALDRRVARARQGRVI